jgi:hypothetical protein
MTRLVEESNRKNSVKSNPSTEHSTASVVSRSETSRTLHARFQVPSVAIILAGMPRSKVTRSSSYGSLIYHMHDNDEAMPF